jgi:hypothetical protein
MGWWWVEEAEQGGCDQAGNVEVTAVGSPVR